MKSRKVDQKHINDVLALNMFGKPAQLFISSIYKSSWNLLYTNNKNTTLRLELASKFSPKDNGVKPTSNGQRSKDKQAEIVKLPPLIPAKPSKKILEKSKFFQKGNKSSEKFKSNNKPSNAQALALIVRKF